MNVETLSNTAIGTKVRKNRSRKIQVLQPLTTDQDLFVPSPKLMSNTEKVRKNRPRKFLQELQPSAIDQDLFVPSPKLMSKTEKKIEKVSPPPFNILEEDSSSKENAPLRRSKRKVPSTQDQPNQKTSNNKTENLSITVHKVASKSKKVSAKKKITTDIKQSKIDSFMPSLPSILETPTEIKKEEALMAPQQSVSESEVMLITEEEEALITPQQSVSEIKIMLTTENPPANYWKELAEQRRIALAEALRENEILSDQVKVIEADNSQLRSILKDAEKLSATLKVVLE
ncbi:hypothetical protein CEXT_720841 [Caerostris extrusa]|uniref:Uncharacterized protein n=1 Tax=Caerostris extrusa TaxID=172846 RepID=A0AAV4PUD0_CAEEX|nr:hypothetical protein CEXT_720841 [Caerostris extrusa]